MLNHIVLLSTVFIYCTLARNEDKYISIQLVPSKVGNEYETGIVTNVDLYNGTSGEEIQQLFLCNTCTFTYIF